LRHLRQIGGEQGGSWEPDRGRRSEVRGSSEVRDRRRAYRTDFLQILGTEFPSKRPLQPLVGSVCVVYSLGIRQADRSNHNFRSFCINHASTCPGATQRDIRSKPSPNQEGAMMRGLLTLAAAAAAFLFVSTIQAADSLPFGQKVEVFRDKQGDVTVFTVRLEQPFLAEEFETAIGEQLRQVPGVAEVLRDNPTLADLAWLGDRVGLHVSDGDSIVQVDPTLLRTLDLPFMGNVSITQQGAAAGLLTALKLPVYVTIDVENRESAKKLIGGTEARHALARTPGTVEVIGGSSWRWH